jgi:hypothetical protein
VRLIERLGARLPPTTFAAERAAVRRAEVEVAAASRKVDLQRERIASLPQSVPAGFDRGAVEANERARLALAEDAQGQALADVELAKARLDGAQETRLLEEKRYANESARQMLAARSQLQQAEMARAQLAAQLAALDVQLAQLAAVRAPFAGRVARISWEEQHDQTLTVVLYLAVAVADGDR